MIPDMPKEFSPASQEGNMFAGLQNLSDDFYVFHSFKMTNVKNNTIYENEIDFVILNKNYGVICLEAKSGAVYYANGYWYYENGTKMAHDGPFNQAQSNKYKLLHAIEEKPLVAPLLSRLKLLHCVWFPSLTRQDVKASAYPPEADKNLVLTKESLSDPTEDILRIFGIELPNGVHTSLNDEEFNLLLKSVFCQEFKVFPSASFDDDLKKIVFHRLLSEQTAVLDFLCEQRTAVINGAAGTGKTMIAVEKAQRHAIDGETVLFLCYNINLKEYLEKNYHYDNVSYYTLAGYACKVCNTSIPDYHKLQEILEEQYVYNKFPYKHVIIDEGQDFGIDAIEETDILRTIKECVTSDNNPEGTFYVFYDRLQSVHSSKIPSYIEDADCKLTLYRNCRNTENIAKTSLSLFPQRKLKVIDGCVAGKPTDVHFCPDEKSEVDCINSVIDDYVVHGLKNIVILTCKTESTSVLSSEIKNGRFRNKYLFSSCRKFKGLEADAVILVDVDSSTFADSAKIFYVGSSRARLRLAVITKMTNDDCAQVLLSAFGNEKLGKNPKKDLCKALMSFAQLHQSI